MKLRKLLNQYGANAFILADKGNGSAYGENGSICRATEDVLDDYGDVELYELDEPHMSDDGHECNYASDWIVDGEGDNPYRVRIFF